MYKIIVFEGIDGAGKTTLIKALVSELEKHGKKVKVDKIAPLMVKKFKEMVDEKTGIRGEYQDVIDKEFRLFSYIIESLIQFEYKNEEYKQYDYVIFDRWMYTNYAYLGEPVWNEKWAKELIQKIPTPDLIFWLRIPVSEALIRLKQKNDWMLERYEEPKLADKLDYLSGQYAKMFDSKGAFKVDATKEVGVLVKEIFDIVDKVS